jgi:hypothetical protein
MEEIAELIAQLNQDLAGIDKRPQTCRLSVSTVPAVNSALLTSKTHQDTCAFAIEK